MLYTIDEYESSDYVIKIGELISDIMEEKNIFFIINLSTEIVRYTFLMMKSYFPNETRLIVSYPYCINTLEQLKKDRQSKSIPLYRNYKDFYADYKTILQLVIVDTRLAKIEE